MNRLLSALFLCMFAGTVLARTVTFNPRVDVLSVDNPYVIEKEGVKLTMSGAASLFAYYVMFPGSTCTITAQESVITSVQMDCPVSSTDQQYSPVYLTADVGNYVANNNDGLWTGNEASIVFTAPNKQVRIAQITVTINGDSLSAPHILPSDEGDIYDELEVSMWCTTDNASIRYTLDGTNPTPNSKKYTSPFILRKTTTVKAITVRGGQVSDVVLRTYTFIDRTGGLGEAAISPIGTTLTLHHDMTVLATDQEFVFVKDKTGYAAFLLPESGLHQGDIISGGNVTATVAEHQDYSLPALENVSNYRNIIGYEELEAEEISIPQIDTRHLGHFVVLRQVVWRGGKTLVDQDGNTCTIYQNFYFPMVIDDDPPVPTDEYAIVVAPGVVFLTDKPDRKGLGTDYSQVADGKQFTINFTPTVLYQHDSYTFARDFTGYGLLYGELPPMCPGDVMNTSSYSVTKATVDGEVRFDAPKITSSPIQNVEIEPELITIQDVNHDFWAHYVVMNDVKVSDINNRNFVLTDATGDACKGYNLFDQPLSSGHYDELTGIVHSYTDDAGEVHYRLLPILPQDTVEVRTISELYELPGNVVARFVQPLRAIYQWGMLMYVRDADGVDEMVSGSINGTFSNGDLIDNVLCHWTKSARIPLIFPVGDWSPIDHGAPVQPHVVNVAQARDMTHHYVQLNNLTFVNQSYNMLYKMGDKYGNELEIYNNYGIDMSAMVKGSQYDVKGFIFNVFNDRPLLHVTEIKNHVQLTGDLNDDGEVTIADVNAIVKAILLNSQDITMDVNNDGELNIADVNAVVHAILSLYD